MYVDFQIEVDGNGKIIDARFKTFGCGSAIASSSLATEWVKGKSVSRHSTNEEQKSDFASADEFVFIPQIDEALKIKNTDIAKELCLPPVKLHCSSKAKFGFVLIIQLLLLLHNPKSSKSV